MSFSECIPIENMRIAHIWSCSKSLYPASRVSFDLPRSVGKRKETLRAGSTFRVEHALKIQTYSRVCNA